MLANLESELRDELREALETLDSDRIAAGIRLVADNDPALAELLSRLADNFDYQTILKALDGLVDQDEVSRWAWEI
jgi:ATP phosphoribosyltransferase regulatory subunit HisZ